MTKITSQEKRRAALAITYAQLLLEHIDDLGFTSLYKQKVKMHCKALIKELEPVIDHVFAKDGGTELETDASQQLVDLSGVVHGLMFSIMAIPAEKVEEANKDISKTIKKYL